MLATAIASLQYTEGLQRSAMTPRALDAFKAVETQVEVRNQYLRFSAMNNVSAPRVIGKPALKPPRYGEDAIALPSGLVRWHARRRWQIKIALLLIMGVRNGEPVTTW